jgi:hypothetical protein
MALPAVVTYQLPPLTASALATSQDATSLAIRLNVTTVLGTNQRRVVVASAGNDAGITFRIIGFNQANMTVTELMQAGNATVVATSELDYIRLISITPLNNTTLGIGTTAGSVTVGASNMGSSLWWIADWHAVPVDIAISGAVVGALGVNYSVQYTYDDPNSLPTGVQYPQPFTHPTVNAATTSIDGSIESPVTGVRLLVNSGSGTVRGTFIQAGIGSP